MPIKELYEKLTKDQKEIMDEVIKTFELDIDKCKTYFNFCKGTIVSTLLIDCEGKKYNTGIPLEEIKL